jgi:prepilin-type N-terminal cleavage/methylation domain-containing protein
MKLLSPTHQMRREEGLGLIEVLVALVIVSVASLAITTNIIGALRGSNLTELHYAASNLALSKIEQLASVNVSDLDSSYNATETALTDPSINVTFTRTTTVVVNSDKSRTVSVTVKNNASTGSFFKTTTKYSTTFALWE